MIKIWWKGIKKLKTEINSVFVVLNGKTEKLLHIDSNK